MDPAPEAPLASLAASTTRERQVATIAVLGAGGRTGRLVLDELVRDGHRVLALTSSPERLRGEVDQRLPAGRVDVRPARARSASGLATTLAGARALVDVAGPYADRGAIGLEAALQAGAHYLDACLEPGESARVHAQDARARAAGVVAVTGGGFPAAVLDLLGSSALAAADRPAELHLATTFPDRGWLRTAGPATRRVLASLLEAPATAVVGGERVEEPLGEARRLAWFPRPVGLAHAAGVPGTATLSASRRDPGLATVREYLAMPGWRAELLQLAASATAWGPARRRLHRAVRGAGTAPPARRGGGVRWACVAETRGTQGTVRAWANGHDPAASAAASLGVLVRAALAHPHPGVRPPAQLAGPGALLDELSRDRDLRWAVIRPGGT